MILIVEKYLHFGTNYRSNSLANANNTSINSSSYKDKSNKNIGSGVFFANQGSLGYGGNNDNNNSNSQNIALDG